MVLGVGQDRVQVRLAFLGRDLAQHLVIGGQLVIFDHADAFQVPHGRITAPDRASWLAIASSRSSAASSPRSDARL